MKKRWTAVVPLALFAVIAASGCTNNQKTDTAAERAGVNAKEGARDTAHAADRSTDNIQRKIGGAAHELKKDTKELAMTAKVKNALMTTPKQLDWKGIDVDTANMTVHLKGTVPNAQQKAVAEKIAREQAGKDFKVMSHLQVK